ncbi:MAG: outer membrane protein assembly factor BamE [Rhodospirillales bacterium]|nr:outer membrane protein assembly factor BamE [Rhodospirillales bacterium]MDE0380715.1 outer membrane protein assembly factor BamE [Rhodospirillales bacterium]
MALRRTHTGETAPRTRAWRLRHTLLGCALAAVLLAGCSPQVHQQGHVRDADALAEIKPGVQTRAEVARLLGTPSAIGTFDDANWYYITRRSETTAFYAPELVDQSITVISFDEDGVVAEVASVSLEEARAIEVVEDETPTRGRELSLLEQLFGNIGRPAAPTR